jgi:pimeloyl-ACP methyl ester carboxylesterase
LIAFCILLFVMTTSTAAQSEAVPRFEPSECPLDIPFHDPECGYLVVPEDRTDPDSPTIRLAVAIFHTRSDDPQPDPVIFLDGGPASRTLDSLMNGLGNVFSPMLRHRDLIMFDYRGVGYSQPSLECPEAFEEDNTDWERRCHDRLVSEGVNLGAYTTRNNAADVADLRRVLGLEQVNIYSGSYGTEVAMALMRDHPEGLRSVTLVSVKPPQANLEESWGMFLQLTLNRIERLCREDSKCDEAYPFNLADAFGETIARLNEAPVQIAVASSGEEPFYVYPGTLMSGLVGKSDDPQIWGDYPALIAALYNEQYEVLLPNINAYSPDNSTEGAFFSMRCNDSTLATTPERVEAALEGIHSAFRDYYRSDSAYRFDLCSWWGVPAPTADELAPVVSDIPTLIIAGGLDRAVPEEWIGLAEEGLSNAYSYLFPAMAHTGVGYVPCARSVVQDFLEDPMTEPDTTCIAETPTIQFYVP